MRSYSQEKPFVEETAGNEYQGLFIDLLSSLSEMIRFNYDIRTINEQSKKDANGQWTGVVGKVTSRVL